MSAVTVSANLDERDAQKVRVLATREHRSVSSFVANAVVVFSDFPKDLRDSLLELRVEEGQAVFRTIAREIAAMVARKKFDLASERLVAQKRLPTLPEDATDQDILDQASNIVRKP
jgi:hypothetical protein